MPICIRIDHYHHFPSGTDPSVAHEINSMADRLRTSNDALEAAIEAVQPTSGVRRSTQRGASMSTNTTQQAVENLRAEVERNDSVDGSATTLIGKLATLIEQNKTNPTELQALADRLRSSNDALTAAVTANTPADEA
jgi:DNA transposition AAA+ family ATPase